MFEKSPKILNMTDNLEYMAANKTTIRKDSHTVAAIIAK